MDCGAQLTGAKIKRVNARGIIGGEMSRGGFLREGEYCTTGECADPHAGLQVSTCSDYGLDRATACNATHVIAMRNLSVGLTFRLSAVWNVTERKQLVPTFLHHTKDHSSYFADKKNGWWGRPLLAEILRQTDPVGAKTPIFNRYSLVAPQPWHLAEKSAINTNRKSTTRFLMSLIWTSYVAPKPPSPREHKNAKRPFFVYNFTSLEESLISFFVWILSAKKL